MSIFSSTLQPYVQAQILVRQLSKSDDTNTTGDYLIVNNSKTTWCRLSSSINAPNGKGISTKELAAKNVLEAGTLFSKGNQYALRAGIGKANPKNPSSVDGAYNMTDKGFRPMPGITNVSIVNKGFMGSLRQATITYVCWSKDQRDDLETLYMRPGYTCLLEWGNSHYLDNKTKKLIVNQKQIDIIHTAQNYTQVLRAIDKARESSYGNYDAMFGYVVNFTSRTRPDGGYDCTTDLISIGSLLESMKMNYISGTSISNSNGESIFNFGKASSGIAVHLNNFYKRGKIIGLLRELLAPQYLSDKNYLMNEAGQKYYKYIHQVRHLYFQQNTYVDPKTNSENVSRGMYYLPLSILIEIVNEYVLLRSKKTGELLSSLSVKDKHGVDIKCVTHKLQTSIDPFVCIVHDKATKHIVTYQIDNVIRDFTIQRPNLNNGKKSDPILYYYDDTYRTASIGNIYVNIEYFLWIIQTNIDKETNTIDVFSTFKKLMASVQQSLGNINNFEIFIDPDDNVGRIIDYAYIEENSKAGKKFKINTYGISTTVRNVVMESTISPEMATMISIAAQTANSDSTMGLDVDSLIRFNQGLVDRVIPAKSVPEHSSTKAVDQAAGKIEQINKIVTELNNFTTEISRTSGFKAGLVEEMIEGLKYSLNGLITLIKKLDTNTSKKINNFIIPIKITLEIDGIAGLTIGEIFTLPDTELPKSYKNANAGFIITGISHSLQGNDWITTVSAQTCILD